MGSIKGKKIIIGTPMYGGQCYSGYVESLLMLQSKIQEAGASFSFVTTINESLITRARNFIADVFMKEGFDFLLFIDGDHRFDANGVVRMLEEDEDIITAICPKKSINWNTVRDASAFGAERLDFFTGDFALSFLKEDIKINANEKFEIESCGTGLISIKRTVFEKLEPLVSKYKSSLSKDSGMTAEYFKTSIVDGQILSEGYNLCKDWRSIGGKVYAAPWVGVTHIGTNEFTGSFPAHLELYNMKANSQNNQK